MSGARIVVVTGPPAVGKSTVARALAERLGRRFIDLDAAIAADAGASITTLFARDGEAAFRARERAMLTTLLGLDLLGVDVGERRADGDVDVSSRLAGGDANAGSRRAGVDVKPHRAGEDVAPRRAGGDVEVRSHRAGGEANVGSRRADVGEHDADINVHRARGDVDAGAHRADFDAEPHRAGDVEPHRVGDDVALQRARGDGDGRSLRAGGSANVVSRRAGVDIDGRSHRAGGSANAGLDVGPHRAGRDVGGDRADVDDGPPRAPDDAAPQRAGDDLDPQRAGGDDVRSYRTGRDGDAGAHRAGGDDVRLHQAGRDGDAGARGADDDVARQHVGDDVAPQGVDVDADERSHRPGGDVDLASHRAGVDVHDADNEARRQRASIDASGQRAPAPFVVAVGAGALVEDALRRAVLRCAHVVLLDASIDVLARRDLGGRPLLSASPGGDGAIAEASTQHDLSACPLAATSSGGDGARPEAATLPHDHSARPLLAASPGDDGARREGDDLPVAAGVDVLAHHDLGMRPLLAASSSSDALSPRSALAARSVITSSPKGAAASLLPELGARPLRAASSGGDGARPEAAALPHDLEARPLPAASPGGSGARREVDARAVAVTHSAARERLAALVVARAGAYAEHHARVDADAPVAQVVADAAAAVAALEAHETLVVPLGTRTYRVHVGPLASLVERVVALAPSSIVLVTDAVVDAAYGPRIAGLQPAARVVLAGAGDREKIMAAVVRVWDAALDEGVDRRAVIVGVGGGVVTDLAGFAAATLLRGVRCATAPTTLLAMVDAAVGGKTGVDRPQGKNLVGAFHQPSVVVVDPAVLATQAPHDLRAGLAEIVKIALATNGPLLARIEANAARLARLDKDALAALVPAAIQAKIDVVAIDEREDGRRALLNFGHTIGHAIEAAAQYALPHGACVAIGMYAALELGAQVGVTPPDVARDAIELLRALALPARPHDVDAKATIDEAVAVAALGVDKKRAGATMRFVLLTGRGAAVVRPVTDDAASAALMRAIGGAS